jgi:pseudouridine synthase
MSEPERIQKIIAASGIYSRRAVEKLIEEGKVSINGKTIRKQGIKIDPLRDKVVINGKVFIYQEREMTEAILFNKPRHVVVTRSDPEGRPTVYDYLPKELKLFKPVGRLDFNSQGALLLTNDGDLVLKLTHPRYHLEKVYTVKLSSHPDEKQVRRLMRGVVLDDGERTMPAEVKVLQSNESSTVLEIKLFEGKNRQIRRMCEAVGLTVKELRRVSIGPISLKNLRSGKFRHLTSVELRKLAATLDEQDAQT